MPTAKLGHSAIKIEASFPDKIKSKTLNRDLFSVERFFIINYAIRVRSSKFNTAKPDGVI